jgi:maltose/moltooligosaccharide transporter
MFIILTKEDPPTDLAQFKKIERISAYSRTSVESFSKVNHHENTPIFSWFAFFTMWSLSTPALMSMFLNPQNLQPLEYAKL